MWSGKLPAGHFDTLPNVAMVPDSHCVVTAPLVHEKDKCEG